MNRQNEVFRLVLESNGRIMRFYKENILLHFKKNSKDNNILSARQFFILYCIIYKKVNTITGISKYMLLSKANISILTTKLEEAEYLLRNKNEGVDSRVYSLEVTEAGLKVFNETSDIITSLVTEKIEKYENGFEGFTDLLFDLKTCLHIDESINDPESIMLLSFIKLDSIYEEIFNSILEKIPAKISIAEMKIIKILASDKEVNFETLTRLTALSYSTLSLQVKSLVERGYITKIKSMEDGRVTYLALTDSALDIVEDYYKFKGEVIISYLEFNTQEELEFAIKTFNTLFKALDAVEPV